jgi:hypothetical protein
MPSEHFKMVDAVFCRLAEREEQEGSDSISDIERVVLLVWHASGIIGNGGFHYFFECALPLPATADAYERIGVVQAASVLRRMQELFPGRHIPDDYDERMAIVSRFYEERAELLSNLEREFYSTDALMEQQLAAWIRVHHGAFHASGPA